jgi:hypothetical protein
VIVYELTGVEPVVEIVRVELKVGLPDAGLKPHEAPVGNPDVHDKSTD